MVGFVMQVTAWCMRLGRWVLADRKRFALAAIGLALVLTVGKGIRADVDPYENYTWDVLPRTTEWGTGEPAILIGYETSPGVGWCGMLVYRSDLDGQLYQVYSCGMTPGQVKGMGLMRGGVTVIGSLSGPEQTIYADIGIDWTFAAANSPPAAGCPYAVTPHQDPNFAPFGDLVFTVATGPNFGQIYTATQANPGMWSFAAMKGFFEHCQNGQAANTLGSGTVAADQYAALTATYDLDFCCDYSGGGGGGGCSGGCTLTWFNFGGGVGAWTTTTACAGAGCQCCDPGYNGTYTGQTYTGTCAASGACGGGGGGGGDPCQYQGGDADADGCCDYVDCDAGDASKCDNCGGGGGDPCGGSANDQDLDGCCDDVDYDNTDPDICNAEDDDPCGKCQWERTEDGEPVPPENDPEGEPVQRWKWVKIRECELDDCKCKEPSEDPNGEEALDKQYTKCEAKCECSEEYLARRQAIYDKFRAYVPDLVSVSENTTGQFLKWEWDFEWLNPAGVFGPDIEETVHFKVSFNPEDWGPWATKIAPALEFCRNLMLVMLFWWFVQFIFHTLLGV